MQQARAAGLLGVVPRVKHRSSDSATAAARLRRARGRAPRPARPVQLILCGLRLPARVELLPGPIQTTRQHALDRIIDEYARDAALALALGTSSQFTEANRDWVRTHAATLLPEIEKGTW